MGIVDAHVHLWDTGVVHLSWFRDELGLARSATAADFAAAAGDVAPATAVTVQAGDTLGEARWLLDETTRVGVGSVAVLQYEAAKGRWAGVMQDALEATDTRMPRVGGIRVSTPSGAADLSDVRWLDRLAARLAHSSRVLELLVRPEQLGATAELARRHPSLAVVVCHLGLGSAQPDSAWRRDLSRLARVPNVAAKLSGVVAGRDAAALREVVGAAVDALGPDRLLFGSDWPISARSLGYAEVVERTAAALPGLSAADTRSLWRRTAERLYRIELSPGAR
ncbi:amidohydrolase family protein [Microbacterium cremeum]|uniref:amidohydrolase family protein n=1 Tax=Microbacterium cremeum TaxID=2782169 RepID=UPI0018898249|nr:amidohydrolase family protein [Microbacterium cremeum]